MLEKLTWVVVADECQAKIFSFLHLHKGLEFKTRLAFPEGRDKIHEFTDERPGRKVYSSTHKVGLSGEVDIEAQLSHQFAKQVAEYLDAARTAKKYQELVLVAPPKFLGDLRNHLSPTTAKLVKASLNKELTNSPIEEITERCQDLIGVE